MKQVFLSIVFFRVSFRKLLGFGKDLFALQKVIGIKLGILEFDRLYPIKPKQPE